MGHLGLGGKGGLGAWGKGAGTWGEGEAGAPGGRDERTFDPMFIGLNVCSNGQTEIPHLFYRTSPSLGPLLKN